MMAPEHDRFSVFSSKNFWWTIGLWFKSRKKRGSTEGEVLRHDAGRPTQAEAEVWAAKRGCRHRTVPSLCRTI